MVRHFSNLEKEKDEEHKEDLIMAPCVEVFDIEKDKGLMSSCSLVNSKINNATFYDFKRINFEDKPLENEEDFKRINFEDKPLESKEHLELFQGSQNNEKTAHLVPFQQPCLQNSCSAISRFIF